VKKVGITVNKLPFTVAHYGSKSPLIELVRISPLTFSRFVVEWNWLRPVFSLMKTLGSVMVAALLAACGQGPQDIAQNPITQPEQPEPSNVEEADPSPQTLKPISGPSVTSPEGGTPTQPEVEPPTEVKPVPPEPPKEEVQPTTPRVPAPGQAELSEAELIARKLISTDPGDNLEVLNEALERWLAEKGALPERVSDLVGEQFLPMLPMAPLGKAFMIDAENRRVIIIVAEK
jgi:hypothetical protein